MLDRVLDRIAAILPFFIAGIVLYLVGVGLLWWHSWHGAHAITGRLAVGDAARDVFTFFQAVLTFVGIGSFSWFLLAPMRHWKHLAPAAAPAIFTWLLVFFSWRQRFFHRRRHIQVLSL